MKHLVRYLEQFGLWSCFNSWEMLVLIPKVLYKNYQTQHYFLNERTNFCAFFLTTIKFSRVFFVDKIIQQNFNWISCFFFHFCCLTKYNVNDNVTNDKNSPDLKKKVWQNGKISRIYEFLIFFFLGGFCKEKTGGNLAIFLKKEVSFFFLDEKGLK